MQYTVRIEQLPAQPLAVVRRRATQQQLASVVPAACGKVWNVLRSQQVAGAGRHVALYWDCQDGQINLEVGVEVPQPFFGPNFRKPIRLIGPGEVIGSATPAGPVATTTHFGPYQQLAAAHEAIRQWCAVHGHTLAGPSWEVYGHWTDECNRDPAKIRTDVFYLLEPK